MSTAPRIDTIGSAQAAQRAHLTEDQLDDHLIGDLCATAAAHLAGCAHCSTRAAEFAAPLRNFSAVSLAWSERQSAAAPMPQISAAIGPWQRSLTWSLAGTMAFAACAAALGLANVGRSPAPADDSASLEAAYTQAAQTPSGDQLTDDNRLLNTIDHETGAMAEGSTTLDLLSVGETRPPSTQAALTHASVQD